MVKKSFLFISFVFFGVSLVALLFVKNYLENKSNPLPVLGEVPAFDFVDSHSKDFSSDALKGKVWVADFIFTTCAGPCPIMTENLASLHRSYLLEKDVRLVSVTVNPAYDSPKVLTEYAKKYGADTDSWHFLTGTKVAIQNLAYKGFKIGHEEDPIFHSPKMVLIDRQSRIRGYYTGTEEDEIKRLFKDISRLLKEKS